MARLSEKEKITAAVREYLKTNEGFGPDEKPFTVKDVALVLGFSRTTLYKYGLDKEIKAADRLRQERLATETTTPKGSKLSEANARLKEELKQAEKRNKALVERLNMVEANAARLGIDPEELHKPLSVF